MANCPECHESVPFLEGMPGRGGPHPFYKCWRCSTPSRVPDLMALFLCLITPTLTAAAYILLVDNFPPDRRYAYLTGGLFVLPIVLYVIGRFLWMFCVKLKRAD